MKENSYFLFSQFRCNSISFYCVDCNVWVRTPIAQSLQPTTINCQHITLQLE